MDEARQLHPPRLPIPPDGLCALEEVLNLGEGRVWVRLVDEGVELLHGLPDGQAGPRTGGAVEAVPGGEVVRDGLLLVLLAVEVLDAVTGAFVLPEGGLVLCGVELGLGVVLDDVDVVDGV